MARKKKEDVQEEVVQDDFLVAIKENCHCIVLKNRTIFCPNGVARVSADEKAELEKMELIA